MPVNYKPEGYQNVMPYLVVKDVAKLLDFTQGVLMATVKERVTGPDGNVRHAEVVIGDTVVMMGEAMGERSPRPGTMYVYVKDCDAIYDKALKTGAKAIMPPADQFYGDRHGGFTDPFGNEWWVATHVEDVSPDEMARRASEHMK